MVISVTESLPMSFAPKLARRLIRYPGLVEKLGGDPTNPKAKEYNYARSLVHRKLIPHIRLGKRAVAFFEDEIDAWLEERRVAVADHVAPKAAAK